MVDFKKFTAFIVFNDLCRNLYFDLAESKGINSTWDVFHIQAGEEQPSEKEVQIMQEVYDNVIKGNDELQAKYLVADKEFHDNVRRNNEERRRKL